jgi:membrane protease YdiL (CAAX protease family)
MVTDFDPYRILQVSPGAEQEEIERAYAEAAATVRDGDEAGQRAVDTAYAVLHDPEQRRAYDLRRSEALAREYAPAGAAEAGPPEYPATCPRCGAVNPPDARFCGSCGSPQAGQAPDGRVPWGYGDIIKAIFVVVGGLIASGIPFLILAEIVAGDETVEDDPTAWAIVLGANFAVQALFIGSAWWFGPRKYHLDWGALGLRRPQRGGVLLVIGLVIAAFGLVMAWGIFLELIGIHPDTDLPEQTYEDWRPIAALVILSVMLAPIGEEIFFRGFVFGSLWGRWGVALAAVASGLLFSLSHVGNPGYAPVLPSIVAIGVLFALAYVYTGSLVHSIATHLVFNTISVVISISTA